MLAGGTGCKEWEAGFVLAELILTFRSLFEGSGCAHILLSTHLTSLIHLLPDFRDASHCVSMAYKPVVLSSFRTMRFGSGGTMTNFSVCLGRVCVELGSGSGLVGVCLQRVKCSTLVLTDGNAAALQNCSENLTLNGIHSNWDDNLINRKLEKGLVSSTGFTYFLVPNYHNRSGCPCIDSEGDMEVSDASEKS